MADGPVTRGELTTALVLRVQTLHAQVVVREQRGIIYGPAADKLTAGQHVKIRITEVDGSNGYTFTASVLGGG